MPRYIKEDKIYPGELRIINALYKEPLTFTQLITQANINRVTLSEYLKRLTRKGIVEHDKTSRQYNFPKTLQPLFKTSFPDKEFLQSTQNIIGSVQIVKRRALMLGSVQSKTHAQKLLLATCFATLLLELQLALNQALKYKDLSVAQEYIRRFSEKHLIPRLQLLMVEAFEDRDVCFGFTQGKIKRSLEILEENKATLHLLLERGAHC